jgi:ankyrin repeat protein
LFDSIHTAFLLVDSYLIFAISMVLRGLPGFDCNGETALHMFASQGDLSAIRSILPKCNASFIMKKSQFHLTFNFDALHTALVFQHLDIALAILERLKQIWEAQEPANGLQNLKELLTVFDPVTRVTTTMLMCRLLVVDSRCLPLCIGLLRKFAAFIGELCSDKCILFFRWGNVELLDRVVDLLKAINHQNSRFPEMLEDVFCMKDRSGLTVLHHAVRSGNKLAVKWCMQNGAVAIPVVDLPSESAAETTKSSTFPVRYLSSLIPNGLSKLTSATLWE